jgi:Ca-activated chloride channel family protein
MRPAVSNLQLTFSGVEVYDTEPATLPNLYHGVPLRIYGRYDQPGTTSVTIKGDVQGQPFEQSVEIELPATDDANPEIERMWAWKRVDQLWAAARERGETDSIVNDIVMLCEDFSIASEYASFIVLENDAEYQRWKIDRKNLSRLERDRMAQAQVREQLDALRNEALSKLGPAATSATTTPSQPLEVVNRAQSPVSSTPPATPMPNAPASRGFDLDLPAGGGGGGGGGAIDPVSAAIGLGLAGAAALAARRRKTSSANIQA